MKDMNCLIFINFLVSNLFQIYFNSKHLKIGFKMLADVVVDMTHNTWGVAKWWHVRVPRGTCEAVVRMPHGACVAHMWHMLRKIKLALSVLNGLIYLN